MKKPPRIHVRLEKLKPILSQFPEIVRRLDRLTALIIQPCHLADSVTFFRIDSGTISEPVVFSIQAAEHTKSQSMESRVLAVLESFPPAKVRPALETMEHLALLKRWYYRGRRVGEIFLADDKGVFPMRRIVRGIGRVFRGEGPEEDRQARFHHRGTEKNQKAAKPRSKNFSGYLSLCGERISLQEGTK